MSDQTANQPVPECLPVRLPASARPGAPLSRNRRAGTFRTRHADLIGVQQTCRRVCRQSGHLRIATAFTQPPQFNQRGPLLCGRPNLQDGDDTMKKLSLILIASFALVTIQGFSGVFADDGGGIPLSKLAGRYADTPRALSRFVSSPTFPTLRIVPRSGAVPVPFNGPAVGQVTQDKDGNLCGAYTGTAGAPGSPGNFPPQEHHFVGKVTNYDPATGTGDKSFTDYIGGKCNGTKFDSYRRGRQ